MDDKKSKYGNKYERRDGFTVRGQKVPTFTDM